MQTASHTPPRLTGLSARPKKAAQILGVALPTFWRYAKRPDFPKLRKLSSRCTVVDVDELIAWRDAQGGE